MQHFRLLVVLSVLDIFVTSCASSAGRTPQESSRIAASQESSIPAKPNDFPDLGEVVFTQKTLARFGTIFAEFVYDDSSTGLISLMKMDLDTRSEKLPPDLAQKIRQELKLLESFFDASVSPPKFVGFDKELLQLKNDHEYFRANYQASLMIYANIVHLYNLASQGDAIFKSHHQSVFLSRKLFTEQVDLMLSNPLKKFLDIYNRSDAKFRDDVQKFDSWIGNVLEYLRTH